uniref:Ubiquitin-like modifier-activating enzyme ATG7 n=1 Tax=Dugesia japonica TaxID=6161 RepID=A0A1P8STG9_DUGJA|nr:autophagy-related protein 7 [Dugesia japonica]
MTENLIKFSPFQSLVDGSFWHVLARKKLDEYKLNEGPYTIYGNFEHLYNIGSANRFMIGMESYEKSRFIHPNIFKIKGKLLVLNTCEDFNNRNKVEFLNSFGSQKILENIKNGRYLKHPHKICQFSLLTYADLKKFNFFYWFAFPAPRFPVNPELKGEIEFLDQAAFQNEVDQFFELFDKLQDQHHNMFFTVFLEQNGLKLNHFSHFDIENKDCILGFCDPSIDPKYPGWPLRNILFAICSTLIPPNEKRTIRVLCYRNHFSDSVRQTKTSSILTLELTGIDLQTADIKFVGWEKYRNQDLPRCAKMASSMNPLKLAENAVDLNLKLMKWRLIPDLDLEKISSTKCLLFGVGTLGCHVARQLLAWNVNNITLVDNSTVSYSNPVRQTLYKYEDSVKKVNKAEQAEKSLKEIYPHANVKGYTLSVPMPGHPLSQWENNISQVEEDCLKIFNLVADHDVIFLLLDTREARWLPTLFGYIHAKLVINAALGFDTYLVMRHGVAPQPGISPSNQYTKSSASGDVSSKIDKQKPNYIPGDELGCYFCTDVVGPSNSTRDRSMDQQCTVTRPGVSMIAAALAVELMVSILQHKDGNKAAVEANRDNYDFVSCLGATPHQIRGYMSCFNSVIPFHRASIHCTACSQKVLDCYKAEGFEFLLKVFNDPDYLEEVAGLKELQSSIDFDCVTALTDSDDDFSK